MRRKLRSNLAPGTPVWAGRRAQWRALGLTDEDMEAEIRRNVEEFEARGPFDPADEPEPFRRRHQFGATLGGPAPWLRGFFFTAVEGVRDRTAKRPPSANLEVADMRSRQRQQRHRPITSLSGVPR